MILSHCRIVFASLACASLAVVACSSEANQSTLPDQTATDSAALTAEEDLRPFRGGECGNASECHGFLPRICARCDDGVRRCSHFECEQNQCVPELCPPPAPTTECTVATDCRGPLPDICERCSTGGEACAHYECEAGQCVVQTCPSPAATDDAGPSPIESPL